MLYNTPCILYYVCPFIFTIELVNIEYAFKEGETLYYIDQTGAYLQEQNLFKDLKEARGDAIQKLDHFYGNKIYEILNCNPILSEDM